MSELLCGAGLLYHGSSRLTLAAFVAALTGSAPRVRQAFLLKKAGKVVGTSKRVVSKDGKELTLTTTGKNAKGQAVNNVDVFEKK